PYIPDHVIESEVVGRKTLDRSSSQKPVFSLVAVREGALEGIGHNLSVWIQFITPGVALADLPASCSIFPFRFSWQSLPGPLGIRCSIFISDMHYWVIPFPLQCTSRAFRVFPVRAFHPYPPGGNIVGGHRL